jgi:hypothetical protein
MQAFPQERGWTLPFARIEELFEHIQTWDSGTMCMLSQARTDGGWGQRFIAHQDVRQVAEALWTTSEPRFGSVTKAQNDTKLRFFMDFDKPMGPEIHRRDLDGVTRECIASSIRLVTQEIARLFGETASAEFDKTVQVYDSTGYDDKKKIWKISFHVHSPSLHLRLKDIRTVVQNCDKIVKKEQQWEVLRADKKKSGFDLSVYRNGFSTFRLPYNFPPAVSGDRCLLPVTLQSSGGPWTSSCVILPEPVPKIRPLNQIDGLTLETLLHHTVIGFPAQAVPGVVPLYAEPLVVDPSQPPSRKRARVIESEPEDVINESTDPQPWAPSAQIEDEDAGTVSRILSLIQQGGQTVKKDKKKNKKKKTASSDGDPSENERSEADDSASGQDEDPGPWKGYPDAFYVKSVRSAQEGKEPVTFFRMNCRSPGTHPCPWGRKHDSQTQGFYCWIGPYMKKGKIIGKCAYMRCYSASCKDNKPLNLGRLIQPGSSGSELIEFYLEEGWDPKLKPRWLSLICKEFTEWMEEKRYFTRRCLVWQKIGTLRYERVELPVGLQKKESSDLLHMIVHTWPRECKKYDQIYLAHCLSQLSDKSKQNLVTCLLNTEEFQPLILKGLAQVILFANGVFCPLSEDPAKAFVPFNEDGSLPQEIYRISQYTDLDHRYPAGIHSQHVFDPGMVEDALRLVREHPVLKIFDNREDLSVLREREIRLQESFSRTRFKAPMEKNLSGLFYQGYGMSEAVYILAMLFGRLQIPVSHPVGDIRSHEVMIKGRSQSGKTYMLAQLPKWFNGTNVIKQIVLAQGDNRVDFWVQSLTNCNPNDNCFALFGDIQLKSRLPPAQLCLCIETGKIPRKLLGITQSEDPFKDQEDKPIIKARRLFKNDEDCEDVPITVRMVFAGTTYPEDWLTTRSDSRGDREEDFQILRRLMVIYFSKKHPTAGTTASEQVTMDQICHTMVFSWAYYRALARANLEVAWEHIMPSKFRPSVSVQRDNPFSEWVEDSRDWIKELNAEERSPEERRAMLQTAKNEANMGRFRVVLKPATAALTPNYVMPVSYMTKCMKLWREGKNMDNDVEVESKNYSKMAQWMDILDSIPSVRVIDKKDLPSLSLGKFPPTHFQAHPTDGPSTPNSYRNNNLWLVGAMPVLFPETHFGTSPST